MSEEKSKITTIQKTTETGKRLTAISKQDKEQKMDERIDEEKIVKQDDAKYNYTYILCISGLIVSLVGCILQEDEEPIRPQKYSTKNKSIIWIRLTK